MREQRVDLRHLADVARERVGLAAVVANAGGDFLAVGKLAARHDDLRAGLRQRARDRFADAAAGAGDDGDLAAEIEQRGGAVGRGHRRLLSMAGMGFA
jgi:hypothetical protein